MTAHVSPPTTAALDQARQFLARAVPWCAQGESYINVTWSEVNPGTEKPIFSGRACRTIDDAMRALSWIMLQPGKREIFVCMSSQRTAQEKTSRTGHQYLAPVRNQQNVVALKSLYLDIDFKGGAHGYDVPDDAVKALGNFLKVTGLPGPSMIVKSGGGLHVHFTLSRALPRAEWQPLANALAQAGKRHGLKADYQVTIDLARLLRIPGTENNKQNTPRPVILVGNPPEIDYPVERLGEALEPYRAALPTTQQAQSLNYSEFLPPRPALAGVSDLSAGIEKSEYPPIHLDDLARECGFIGEAIATGGQANFNPMWNLTTLVATFTDDARNDAHRMGNRHPGYTKTSTDEFFDRKAREKDQRGLEFPTCATISATGSKACQTCPHFSKGKSPLSALPREVAPPAEPPAYADPYADFAGPSFPVAILPPVLADFVEAQRQAMGADPSALAMAALTALAGAIHAETKIKVGDGWVEPPIIWTALIGPPSAMKSPIIDKVIKPLRKTDAARDAAWRRQRALWEQAKVAGSKPGPCPPKPARGLLQDATAEKVAEILSRDAAGSLMAQDELAGWLEALSGTARGHPRVLSF